MSDFSFTLTTATKEATPPLIACWGRSGTGKTLSMLKLARGIVGSGTIALIDTENGRAKFYADEAGGWKHLDLQPPFTPEKYSAAFRFVEEQGADIIIVDSMSHVWEGEGGVLDMADNAKSAKGKDLQGLAKWKAPKTQYKRMMNTLIRSPLPVIFGVRAKEKFVQSKENGFDVLKSEGDTPIMDKNFIYEMTVALHMENEGRFNADSKIPSFLKSAFPVGTQVSEAMGIAMMEAMGKTSKAQVDVIKLKRDGQDAALSGTESLKAWFESLENDKRSLMKPFMDQLKKDAATADKEATQATEEEEKL